MMGWSDGVGSAGAWLAVCGFMVGVALRTLGLGTWWQQTTIVRRFPVLA